MQKPSHNPPPPPSGNNGNVEPTFRSEYGQPVSTSRYQGETASLPRGLTPQYSDAGQSATLEPSTGKHEKDKKDKRHSFFGGVFSSKSKKDKSEKEKDAKK